MERLVFRVTGLCTRGAALARVISVGEPWAELARAIVFDPARADAALLTRGTDGTTPSRISANSAEEIVIY